MKKIDLGQTLSIVANLGVIVGIAFLAVELRQANKIAVASTEISLRDSFAGINESIYANTEVAEMMLHANDPSAELSDLEVARLTALMRRFFNTWLAIEVAYTNGMVPESTYASVRDDIESLVRDVPAARPIFRDLIGQYPSQGSSQVYRYVDEALGAY